MPNSICIVPVAPIRSEASHRSEQVSQLLFGESVEIFESKGDFIKIKSLYDNYHGWCQATQLLATEQPIKSAINKLAGNWSNEIFVNGELMRIPFGACLDILDHQQLNRQIEYKGEIIESSTSFYNEEMIKKVTNTFINTSYLWGGRSVFGIDCSGFTQIVFKFMNIPLLRDASQQATMGNEVENLDKTECGDLAFFDNQAGRITHVGILLDKETIIHASGKVRVDSIDQTGIISRHTKEKTHSLKTIRRMV